MALRKHIDVVAGIVTSDSGAILLQQRPPGKPMAGRWEFPGGKIEPGETAPQALTRELHEELGIRVHATHPLIRLRHDYPELTVDLTVSHVTDYSGQPYAREGQVLDWTPICALRQRNFLDADWPVIAALQLPTSCWVTPSPNNADIATYLDRVDATLAHGIRMVQCRLPTIPSDARLAWGRRIQACCRAHGAIFIWNGTAAEATTLRAHGLHISANTLAQWRARPDYDGWIGASCHCETDIRRANQLQLDYVFAGSVQPTASHPGGTVLGWEAYARLVAIAHQPVYAIGGMVPGELARVRQLGGHGIAAIRGFSSTTRLTASSE